MKLGQKIKKVREDSDLTLDELSSIINKKYGFATNKGMISKWENGITTPSLQFIQAYAKEFNVDLNYLLDTGIEPSSAKKIPLIGTIAAGTPVLAEENIEDYFNLDSSIKADFALRIKGDSMLGAGIFPNDIVFIKQQCELENGEIGAILIENEATLKKFYRDNGTIILQAENDKYEPIILTNGNVKIMGKLAAVLNIRE